MRFFVLAFMIVLLPLRAIAGDVMAVYMASSAIAIETGASRPLGTDARASFDHQIQAVETSKAVPDCHGQQMSVHAESRVADAANRAVNPGNDHCSTCAACQACHTLALSPDSPSDMVLFASPQLRQTSSAMFTSADAALGQKPPIA